MEEKQPWIRQLENPLEIIILKELEARFLGKNKDTYFIEIYDYEMGENHEGEIEIDKCNDLPHRILSGTVFRLVSYKEKEETKYGVWPEQIYYDEKLQKEFFERLKEQFKKTNQIMDSFIEGYKKTNEELKIYETDVDIRTRLTKINNKLITKALSEKIDENGILEGLIKINEIENGDLKTKLNYIHDILHKTYNFFEDCSGEVLRD
ncbi:MAG: hypothetical protein PHF86_11870 [Candidatus Nanoarchaeia archaeon]|nr:hypothetical protein [Candidatus Nanoarchaeia archaeon]